jgi:hypothetical protein
MLQQVASSVLYTRRSDEGFTIIYLGRSHAYVIFLSSNPSCEDVCGAYSAQSPMAGGVQGSVFLMKSAWRATIFYSYMIQYRRWGKLMYENTMEY